MYSAEALFTDQLRPFQIERPRLRGRALRLGSVLDQIINTHQYPYPVSKHLAELTVIAGGLVGGLKFSGSFSLQIRGDGPVNMMVADVTNEGGIRAYALMDDRAQTLPDDAHLSDLTGKGVLALTIDQRPSGGEVYQGIVETGGSNLSECMLRYFGQSEQILTGIKLAVDYKLDENRWLGAAIIVQAMPGDQRRPLASDHADDWRRCMMLLDTASDEELTDHGLELDQLLFRLFHEEGVRVYDPWQISFSCSCDQARVERMLTQFSLDDIEEMQNNDGGIDVKCQFCGRGYLVTRQQVAQLVKSAKSP